MHGKEKNPNPLWTRDFTIITLGSVVSMMGNAMAGFAMSLLVLDYTASPFLYAIYLAVYTLPQAIMPVFSGALLDRFSRKKTIYALDFISAGLYVLMAVILKSGYFSFPVLAVYSFVLGSIQSTYTVAYQSFYPLLITEGNFSKAYSISSVLETMSMIMIPVAAYLYKRIGIAPLLAGNAVFFLLAAIMETQIRAEEKYIGAREEDGIKSSGRKILNDISEGMRYLWTEKGLLAVAIYFAFSSLTAGASQVITLPFFKGNFNNGEYVYMMVWGMALLGRAVGGGIQYKLRLPVKWKYAIALAAYVVTSLMEGIYLYTPIPAMMVLCFAFGFIGVISYTIRLSATQSYVPDEKKGRFNGAFNMLNTVGTFSGELIAGALTTCMPVRSVLLAFMLLNSAAAVVIIGGGKRHVQRIYNTQQ